MCDAPGCETPPTMSWRRQATAAEIDRFVANGDLPPGETTAEVTMLGCDPHRVDDHRAAGIHQASCTAPPATDGACNCEPYYPPATPAPGT